MSQILGSSRISKKGQLTIPKTVRDDLGLQEGDLILFVKKGNEIKLKRGELRVTD